MRPRRPPPVHNSGRGRNGRHRPRGGQQQAEVIKVLQANVGRSGPRTDALLRRADKEGVDIVLVQEPGGYWSAEKECPRTSSTYQAILPREGSGRRPRFVTYVRRTSTIWPLCARQDLLPAASDDVLVTSFQTATGQPLWIVNVYSAPSSSNQAPEAGAATVRQLLLLNKLCLVGGDFNLHHADWSTDTWRGDVTREAEAFATWLREDDWTRALPDGTVTHMSPCARY
ncbi:hypothetical protein V8E36_007671 [Tilletia maclaganii]